MSSFNLTTSMMQVNTENKWLLAIENLDSENVFIEKIDLYWNGGDCQMSEKREFNLMLSQEKPSDDTLLNSIEQKFEYWSD